MWSTKLGSILWNIWGVLSMKFWCMWNIMMNTKGGIIGKIMLATEHYEKCTYTNLHKRKQGTFHDTLYRIIIIDCCILHGFVKQGCLCSGIPNLQWRTKLLFWCCKHDIGKTMSDSSCPNKVTSLSVHTPSIWSVLTLIWIFLRSNGWERSYLIPFFHR